MKKLAKRVLYVSSTLTALCYSSVALAQGAATKVAEAPGSELVVQDSAGKENLFEMIMLGGWVMIPLGLCSLVTLTLLLEREIMLRKVKVVPDAFWSGMKGILAGGKANLDKAFEYCVNSKTPIGDVLKVGIEKWKKDRNAQDVEKGIEDAASREVSKMARTLRGFKIVAGLSPLLGLLGTVYGMIKTFQTVAAASEALGQDKAAKLAAGIYQAMVTTAAGLTIAIPTLLIYYYMNRRVDAFADDIEVVCTEFMDEYQEANK